MAKLKTFKISYETKDGTNWTAYLLSFDAKEASRYTQTLLGSNFRTVRELSEVSRVDAITDEAREFLKPHLTSEKEDQLLCPWCSKKFDSSHGLKIHLKKQHMSSNKSEEQDDDSEEDISE
mgnify:CR=1 FL=1